MKRKIVAILSSGVLVLSGCAASDGDTPTGQLTIYDTSSVGNSDTVGETTPETSTDVPVVILPTSPETGTEDTESFVNGTDSSGDTVEGTEEPSDPNVQNPPKYVFLFIGDGMGYAQIQAASYFKSAVVSADQYAGAGLNFMEFPVQGNVTNYNSDTRITDSASAATAIASGKKTVTDRLNIAPDASNVYETIAEQLRDQLGYQIGIVSTATINHATPAAFYGHQLIRTMYYELGQELMLSNFNYFGGGQLRWPTGSDGTQPDLYELAAANGYQVFRENAALANLTAAMDRVLIVNENAGESMGMPYVIDTQDENAACLADYVRAGIEVMSDADSFFMMAEGGLIDWAAHENDVATMVHELLDFEKAIGVALEFYREHPEDTLILVTADHETGGLTLGYSNTDYALYPELLAYQQISYWAYANQYVAGYREQQTDWETVLWEMRSMFGLTVEGTYQEGDAPRLLLNTEEIQLLYNAYTDSLAGKRAEAGTFDFIRYGSYEPLAYTVCQLMANKSGFDFTTIYHTGVTIPIYAIGNGAEKFGGGIDNTDIYWILAQLLGIQAQAQE